MARDAAAQVIECDVCGVQLQAVKKRPVEELNLCEECRVDFGRSKVAACC